MKNNLYEIYFIESLKETKKRYIETSFGAAYAYSWNRGDDEETSERCEKYLNYAKTEEGFINLNLEKQNFVKLGGFKNYFIVNNKIIIGKNTNFDDKEDIEQDLKFNKIFVKVSEVRRATKEEIEEINKKQEEEEKKFTKRLKTYYKKYSSKIEIFSYYCD